jgi:hypothetical protein
MDVVHSMILDDQKISDKNKAETLVIFRESVGYIIHEILDMRKLSVKWVPKCLSAVRSVMSACFKVILDQFRRNPVEFFNRLVTMDETWIHLYDPETKEQF